MASLRTLLRPPSRPGTPPPESAAGRRHHVLPGLAVAAGGAAAAFGLHALWPGASPLVLAAAVGAVLANSGCLPPATTRGLAFAARALLRVGVVLLGFRLAAGDLLRIGVPGLGVVVTVVTLTFAGTLWAGRRLRLSRDLTLLVATGFSICGASAVAAVDGVVGADGEDAAYAVGLVTLCGTLAVVVLPLLSGLLGLGPERYGAWAGASVHDVAQVVAAAAPHGRAALNAAVVVKLARVVLLAPLVVGVGLVERRRVAEGARAPVGPRPPLVPGFVAAFLGAVALRSLGFVPAEWLGGLAAAEKGLLAVALVGLGAGVHVGRLRRLGGRPVILGLSAWVLVAAASYAGVRLLPP